MLLLTYCYYLLCFINKNIFLKEKALNVSTFNYTSCSLNKDLSFNFALSSTKYVPSSTLRG